MTVLGPEQLVLCSGSLPRATGLRERLSAARQAGFDAVSLWGRDYAAARRDGLGDADIRTMIDDHGLAVAELDPAWWWLPGAESIAAGLPPGLDDQEVFAFGERELFRIAGVVGARSVNAVDVFGGSWGVDDAAAAFAGLCDRAAEHGLLVHIEFLPWSRIPDLPSAWAVVRRAGRPNGGIAVDAWHFFRSGSSVADLRAIPGERILGIQLDDGPLAAEADLLHATLHERVAPGDGELDLPGLVRALTAAGAAAPIGVEVFSDVLQQRPAGEIAQVLGDATRRVLGAADASGRALGGAE